jgi:hypothetical protein
VADGLSGDFRKLALLKANLANLARVPSQAAREASTEINQLIQQEFDDGRDPYGKAWAPLRPATLATGRTPPPLTKSGKMRSGTLAKPLQGIGIGLSLPFPGYFHQRGTRRMRARPVLPYGGMPRAWSNAIRNATARALARQLQVQAPPLSQAAE